MLPRTLVLTTMASFRTELIRRFETDGPNKLALFFEMDDNKIETSQARIECRVDGPYVRFLSENEWHARVEVNLLVVTTWHKDDLYVHWKACDTALNMLTKDFQWRDLGTKTSSKETLGCYQLSDRDIYVSHHGQVDANLRLYQSSLEAHYHLTGG